MQTHIEDVHSGPISCLACERPFSNTRNPGLHQRSPTACKPFKCNTCTKRFRIQELLESHICKPPAPKLIRCNACSKKFSSQELLKSHLCVPPGSELICPYCKDVFSKKFTVAMHIDLNHALVPRFQCKLCGQTFKNSVLFTEHCANPCKPLPFRCERCLRTFEGPRLLESHICCATSPLPSSRKRRKATGAALGSNVTSPSRSNRPAAISNPPALHNPSPRSIQQHLISVQSGQPPSPFTVKQVGPQEFQCSGCGHLFSRREHAERHIDSVRLGKHAVQCGFCKKGFRDSLQLARPPESRMSIKEEPPRSHHALCGKGLRSNGLTSIETESSDRAIRSADAFYAKERLSSVCDLGR